MNLHVLHLIDSLSPGGAERMLVDIANQTISEGAMASVCITRSGVDMATELDPKIELNVLNRQKRFDFAAMKTFSSFVKKQSIDIVHCHGRSSFSLAATSRAMRDIQIPLLLHDHYGKIELDNSIPLWFRIWGRHYVAQYVGVSESLGRWAVNAGVKATKINVIENALNLYRINQSESVDIRAQLKLPEESIIGIVIAGLRYEKGIDYLIEALSHCKTDKPFHIVIIGGEREKSYLGRCNDIAEQLGLSDRIFFVGEKKDSAAWIMGADFGLIPSRSESGPLVLIEYMAAGLPVVASLTGSIAIAAAASGVPGFAECGNKEKFSNEIVKLCNLPPEARKKRGELGRRVAENRFDIRRTMMEWFRIYQAARNGSQS
jgi:glycosyltransferase involved in cell wall biosynthesis